MHIFSKVKRNVKEIHTKKPHLEFFTALLTIPMLLTVVALNLNNLRAEGKEQKPEPTPIVINQTGGGVKEREVIVTKPACEPGIGEFDIASPSENEEVGDNPVMVDINYEAGEFCEVVWSYRINGGRWSDYDDRSFALYNLKNGDIKIEVRVKSVVNDDSETFTRRFVYNGEEVPTNTPTTNPNSTTQ
jgi:hypothetical protein